MTISQRHSESTCEIRWKMNLLYSYGEELMLSIVLVCLRIYHWLQDLSTCQFLITMHQSPCYQHQKCTPSRQNGVANHIAKKYYTITKGEYQILSRKSESNTLILEPNFKIFQNSPSIRISISNSTSDIWLHVLIYQTISNQQSNWNTFPNATHILFLQIIYQM